MKIPLSRCSVVAVAILIFAACDKTETASTDVAREAETRLPAEDQVGAAETSASVADEKRPSTKSDADFLNDIKEQPAAVSEPGPAAKLAPADDRAAYEAWFKKYHLDLNDPKMLDADPDGDGFTNREEFLAGTDPLDPKSHPMPDSEHPFIRLKEYSEVRLPLVLESVRGETAVIRRTDGGDVRTETVHDGETLHGFPLVVKKVSARKETDKDGNPSDRSQVLLEDATTKERVTLVKDLPAKTSATYAVLVSSDGKTSVKVHAGEVFSWPGETGVTYRVVDLGSDQIMLQEQETRKLWTVPRK